MNTLISKNANAMRLAKSYTQVGFTLIEVMVALAILSVVAVMAVRTSNTYLRSVDNLTTRTLAHFVAQNTANDLQINQEMITTQLQNKVENGGRSWQVTLTPAPFEQSGVNATARQIVIAVAPILDDQVQNTLTDLTIVRADIDDAKAY